MICDMLNSNILFFSFSVAFLDQKEKENCCRQIFCCSLRSLNVCLRFKFIKKNKLKAILLFLSF